MTIKTILAATALTLAPVLAFAQCSSHDRQVMTCAEGTVFDPETNTCQVITG